MKNLLLFIINIIIFNIKVKKSLTLGAVKINSSAGMSNDTSHIPLDFQWNDKTLTLKNQTVSTLHNEISSKLIGRKIFALDPKMKNISIMDKLELISDGIRLFIDLSEENFKLFRHFWRSTGHSVPEPFSDASKYLLSLDEQINLALIGSLPHNAIRQVRVHWMLNMVKAKMVSTEPIYDFQDLDKYLDMMYQWKLKPGFELMGNPSRLYDDFENETQIIWRRNMVETMASRYVGRYGINWVKSWNWETWNEPDHHDFDYLNITQQGFLNYFDASRSGLDSVSSNLKFGGPGGSCRDPNFSKFCWALLSHVNSRGPNKFKQKSNINLDFISFHKKGNKDVDSLLKAELLTISKIHQKFPNLKNISIYNDEGDFEKGWWRPGEWKCDGRYAALVAKSVIVHSRMKSLAPFLNYELLSFDNAFLNRPPNYFNQRTLFTRFIYNDSSTNQKEVQFVIKPSYDVMALLSLLGNRVLLDKQNKIKEDRFHFLATYRCTKNGARDNMPNTKTEKHTNSKRIMDFNRFKCLNRAFNMCNKIQSYSKDNVTIFEYKCYELFHFGNLTMEIKKLERKCQLLKMMNLNTKNINFKNGNWHIMNKLLNNSDFNWNKIIKNERLRRLQKRFWDKFLLKTSSNIFPVNIFGKLYREDNFEKFFSVEEISVLVTFVDGVKKISADMVVNVTLELPLNFVNDTLYVAIYSLGIKKDVYDAWTDLGRPKFPSRKELQYVRKFQGASRTEIKKIKCGTTQFTQSIILKLPSVAMIHICKLRGKQVLKPPKMKMIRISNMDLLITWKNKNHKSRCVSHFKVFQSKSGDKFSLIKMTNGIENNYLYSVLRGSVTGWYKVQVVLYNGFEGPISKAVYVN